MKRQLITFAVIFFALLIIFRGCSGNEEINELLTTQPIGVATVNEEYEQDSVVQVKIKNNSGSDVTIFNDCPSEPLDVLKYKNAEWTQLEVTSVVQCDSSDAYVIPPEEELLIEYDAWSHALFGETGRYKIRVEYEMNGEIGDIETNEFKVKNLSGLGYFWRTFLYQPIYNALVAIISIVPGSDLGLAIILLTLLLRFILFIPSQKGINSQRKLQEVQPMLKKVQEKYKNDQQKLAQETLAIYKQYKVNPLGSCLPLLIQFPILIALFYVIKGGLNPDNVHLLYEPLKNVDLVHLNTNFLGILELTERNIIVLPLVVALLQFVQMKLSTSANLKNFGKKKDDKKGKKDKKGEKKVNEMQMATNMMVYIMPAMIALFTASVPAGVGLYWGVSTVFGIGQQVYSFKKKKKKKKNKAEVKVIENVEKK